ncbi:MAG: hypothetical protein JXB33_07410 [Clostridia bacterium]|nr:hypothetical protein [Clostridia bacterium]
MMNNEAPINISSNRQLFINESFITNSRNVRIKVHKPIKAGETNLKVEGSSHIRIGGYNSVACEDGEYKIWYTENDYRSDGIHICVKYARSSDGIIWEAPELGLADGYEGKPNNVVLGYGAGGVAGGTGDGTCMVFVDRHDTMGKKYKMTARHGIKEPLGLYSSADGMNWTREIDMVLDDGRFSGKTGGCHLDSQNVIFWDDRIKKYAAYVRKNYDGYGQFRTVARGESERLDGFPKVDDMITVLQTDSGDLQVDTGQGRRPACDFYTNAAMKYPWAQDAYFMFPGMYFKYDVFLPEFSKEKPRNAGPIDIRFASSDDGIEWNRHDREVFAGIGANDDFDAFALYMLNGIVPGNNNDMYMYYMGTDIIHGWDRGDEYEDRENRILTRTGFDSKRRVSAIGRLVIRRDGFTSARSDYKGGEFTTPGLIFRGKHLYLNIDTAASGIVSVGIKNTEGNYYKGFSPNDCRTIHTCNNINKKVEWMAGADLSELEGKAVKLYFRIHDADLYAFQFSD